MLVSHGSSPGTRGAPREGRPVALHGACPRVANTAWSLQLVGHFNAPYNSTVEVTGTHDIIPILENRKSRLRAGKCHITDTFPIKTWNPSHQSADASGVQQVLPDDGLAPCRGQTDSLMSLAPRAT